VIEPGVKAPDFRLYNQDGEEVSLSDFAGRKVMLVFYPADFSDVCTNQLSVYQEVLDEIERKGVHLLGVSVDSAAAHRAFRERLGLDFPLLADFHPKGAMSASYGAYLDSIGITNRSLVLIDGDGFVRWVHEAASLNDLPGANLIFDALAEVGDE
jgi:peroxiredoxin